MDPAPSVLPAGSPTSYPAESSQEPSEASTESDEDSTTEEDRVSDGINNSAILNEVRSSMNTISSAVEELATTVKDFLGLSDTETNSSDDYDHDANDERMGLSWAKVRSRARQRRQLRHQLEDASGIDQAAGDLNDSASDGEGSKKRRDVKPEIRDCNFEQFQSMPAGDSKLYCVDVLLANDSLDEEILRFKETIVKIETGSIESWKPASATDQQGVSFSEDAGQKWVRRIRINSRAVLEVLQHVQPQTKVFRGRPIVFYRPFQLLVSIHGEVEKRLAEMKSLSSHNNPSQELCDSEGALDEVMCYVNFMQTRIIPDSRRYRDPSSGRPETVRYEDLWYLFKPGDLIYIPRNASSTEELVSSESSQRFFRLIQTRLTTTSAKCHPIDIRWDDDWTIHFHYIEYDGSSYGVVKDCINLIVSFSGEKKVTDLPVYPMHYLRDSQVMVRAQSNGATYVSLIERRSGFYSGWTQTANPLTWPDRGNRESPEHIVSDILVDFQETFNIFPEWMPSCYEGLDDDWAEDEDPSLYAFQCERASLPMLEWDEKGRMRQIHDDQVLIDATEGIEAVEFMKNDLFGQLSQGTSGALPRKFLPLLPGRFFAYAVLQRKFVELDIRFVRSADLESTDKAFQNLQISKVYKKLIVGLVKSHFDKIETEKRMSIEIETQDLIRGKGKGIIVLLHGPPGVGKTATAEAVALKFKRPLFPITCGDLGYTAETLEKSLNDIFRLAHHWGCVLLLDEADVFITQRERHDLKRNALVSGKKQKLSA